MLSKQESLFCVNTDLSCGPTVMDQWLLFGSELSCVNWNSDKASNEKNRAFL
jgi:hypothetical protein